MTMAGKPIMVALIFGAFFAAASNQDVDSCSLEGLNRCYEEYSALLSHPFFYHNPEGEYEEEDFVRACRQTKEKAPCHLELANCSDEVRSSFGNREKGYEATRDIVCERTPWKDFVIADQCMDHEKADNCVEQQEPPVYPPPAPIYPERQGPPPYHPFCFVYETEIKCFEPAFNSSCQISIERAKAAFIRAYEAMALLSGCKESTEDPSNPKSSATFLEPELALGVLLLTLLLQRMTTP